MRQMPNHFLPAHLTFVSVIDAPDVINTEPHSSQSKVQPSIFPIPDSDSNLTIHEC